MINYVYSIRPIITRFQQNPNEDNTAYLFNLVADLKYKNPTTFKRYFSSLQSKLDSHKNESIIIGKLIYETFEMMFNDYNQIRLPKLNYIQLYENSEKLKLKIEENKKIKIPKINLNKPILKLFSIFDDLFSQQTYQIDSLNPYKESDLI